MTALEVLYIRYLGADEPGDGTGSGVTDQAPQVVGDNESTKSHRYVAYLRRKAQREGTGDAAAHAQTMGGTEKTDHESDWN